MPATKHHVSCCCMQRQSEKLWMHIGSSVADALLMHHVAAIFCVKWLMAAILKVSRQIETPIPSIDAYLLEETSCQISPSANLKRRTLGFFGKGRPNNKKKNNKIRSETRSVPDLKRRKCTQSHKWLKFQQYAGRVYRTDCPIYT